MICRVCRRSPQVSRLVRVCDFCAAQRGMSDVEKHRREQEAEEAKRLWLRLLRDEGGGG